MSGPQSEEVQNELQVLVKEFGLNLIIECNKTTVGYLDISVNLLDGPYKSYQKPENTFIIKPLIKRNSFMSCSLRLLKSTQKIMI